MGLGIARARLRLSRAMHLGDGIDGAISRGAKASLALKEALAVNQGNNIHSLGSSLPHHRLHVYGKSLELLAAVRSAQVRDAKLRDEALRAAKGVCLNIAGGSGRVTRADKGRAYAIARGECVECVAAVEIAGSAGDACPDAVAAVTRLGNDVYRMLGGLLG
jgi:four helix bundle protein